MSEQVRLNHSADDVDQMRKDWAESFHFDAPADLPGLLDDYDALHAEVEALRAENAKLRAELADSQANDRTAMGYLSDVRQIVGGGDFPAMVANVARIAEALCELLDLVETITPFEGSTIRKARTALAATPAPEAPDHIAEASKMAEQGERQEVFVWMRPDGDESFELTSEGDYLSFPLYRAPQPGQDVRGLAASLYQACGAYDMPERILDALSAAANGEPFTHMIDDLLPCVPPSGECVRSLVEALEECAASLAWNCFGECRAIHAGPIMPAAKALDTARAALATHRQAQRQA